MEHALNSFWIPFASFISIISVVFCKITTDTFEYKPDFDGKTCPVNEQIFTMTALRKTFFVNTCSQTPGCKGVAYKPGNMSCTGCSGHYEISTNLVDLPGTLFYAAVITVDCGSPIVTNANIVLGTFDGNSLYGTEVTYTCTSPIFLPHTDVIKCQLDAIWSTPDCVYVDCGTPSVSDANIVLGTFDGNSLYGMEVTYTCSPPVFYPHTDVITCQDDATWSTPACVYIDCGTPVFSDAHVALIAFGGNTLYGSQVTYTCTPCTFFPRTIPASVTCQADATWSTPDCVYGPDAGYLSNGEPIPPNTIGCAKYFNDTCSENGITGSLLRFDGHYGNCFCDVLCCTQNDCCFDSTCNDAYFPS